MSNQFIIEIILCSIVSGVVVSIIPCILIILLMRYLKNKIPGLIGTIYQLKQSNDNLSFDIDQISLSMDRYNNSVESLQLSFDSLAAEYNTLNENKLQRMPSPTEVEQIEKTITDLLQIEISLSKNLKIANKDSLQKICQDTIKTYPGISTEYIIRKATSIVESFSTD